MFWAYFLVSAALLIVLLTRLPVEARPASTGWVVAFVIMATIAPGFSFGQREHASVLFAMPYHAAAALRLQGGNRLEDCWPFASACSRGSDLR